VSAVTYTRAYRYTVRSRAYTLASRHDRVDYDILYYIQYFILCSIRNIDTYPCECISMIYYWIFKRIWISFFSSIFIDYDFCLFIYYLYFNLFS